MINGEIRVFSSRTECLLFAIPALLFSAFCLYMVWTIYQQ
jgi:hypothetical protein